MKFEINIPDDFIAAKLKMRIDDEIERQLNSWDVREYVAEQVKSIWTGRADKMIAEVLEDAPALRLKVVEEVKSKLLRQVNAAMKAADK